MKNKIENINLIADAIREPATASLYDWHMFWLGVIGIFISAIVAGCATYYAYKLNKKQTEIAERQSRISEEQTEIAKKQTEIMEQQNKIALFDKRFEVVHNFNLFTTNVFSIADKNSYLNLKYKSIIAELKDEERKIFIINLLFYKINDYEPQASSGREKLFSESYEQFKFIITVIERLQYLFPLNDDEVKHIDKIYEAINGLFSSFDTVDAVLKNILNLQEVIQENNLTKTLHVMLKSL